MTRTSLLLLALFAAGCQTPKDGAEEPVHEEHASDAQAREKEQEYRRADEAAVLENQIEVLLLAARGLSEADHHDAVNRLELSLAWRRAEAAGRLDEAEAIHARAPSHGEEVEILVFAEDVYREGDMPDRADMVSAGTERYWVDAHEEHAHEEHGEDAHDEFSDEERILDEQQARLARIERLQRRLHELQARIQHLQDEIATLEDGR